MTVIHAAINRTARTACQSVPSRRTQMTGTGASRVMSTVLVDALDRTRELVKMHAMPVMWLSIMLPLRFA